MSILACHLETFLTNTYPNISFSSLFILTPHFYAFTLGNELIALE